jgi:hypothetical protein
VQAQHQRRQRTRGIMIYNLLFKSCRFAPQCLRKTESQQSTRLLIYINL